MATQVSNWFGKMGTKVFRSWRARKSLPHRRAEEKFDSIRFFPTNAIAKNLFQIWCFRLLLNVGQCWILRGSRYMYMRRHAGWSFQESKIARKFNFLPRDKPTMECVFHFSSQLVNAREERSFMVSYRKPLWFFTFINNLKSSKFFNVLVGI